MILLWAALVLALGALAALLVVLVLGWVGSERALRPPHPLETFSLSQFPLPVEEVRFPSRDGLRLAGWFAAGTNGATVILCHGYGGTRTDLLPHAAFLHRAGYSVLLFDQRARGESEGKYVAVGGLERWDVLGAVDYLLRRPRMDPWRIGAVGLSAGGAATLLAAAESPHLRALVVDSVFRSLHSAVAQSFQQVVGLPAPLFAFATVKVSELRLGWSAGVLAPERVMPYLRSCALFLIHGLEDQLLNAEASSVLFELAHPPKELWLIPGAGHAAGLQTAGEEYQRRVVEFFGRHLLASTSQHSAAPVERA